MALIFNSDFRFIPDDSAETDHDTIFGRDESDLIDFIDGGGGHDAIYGRDGSDVLIGGAGYDYVAGGDGGKMDFLLGGILDTAKGLDLEQLPEGLNLEQAIAELSGSGLLGDTDVSDVLAGLVNILDNATNLQDVVNGVTEALAGASSEVQQAVGTILAGLPEVLTWQQDDSSDVFKAYDSFEENGVDIIFGYDYAGNDHDIIDFGEVIDLPEGNDQAKEDQLLSEMQYDEDTGALSVGQDNWFFVYRNVDPLSPTPADTVYVEADGDVFVWDTSDSSWEISGGSSLV